MIYITASHGPEKKHASVEDAIAWIAKYVMTPKARYAIPKLWIYDKNNTLIGDLYVIDKEAKIMSGENKPSVLHVCYMLRNTITKYNKKTV